MDRSPYLQQALQSMSQPPPAAPQMGAGMADVAAALMQARRRQMPQQGPRGLPAAAQNLRALPQRIAQVPGNVVGNLKQLPGLFGLGQMAMK